MLGALSKGKVWNPRQLEATDEEQVAEGNSEELLMMCLPTESGMATLGSGIARLDALVLHRAAALNGRSRHLITADAVLVGAGPHAAAADREGDQATSPSGRQEDKPQPSLATIVAMRIKVTVDDKVVTLKCPRTENDYEGTVIDTQVVDRIVVDLEVRRGAETRHVLLPTDLAIDADDLRRTEVEETGILTTPETKLTPQELSGLLWDGLFEPSLEEKSDSFETQCADFEVRTYRTACDALLEPDRSTEEKIRHAVAEQLAALAPKEQGVVISYSPEPGDDTNRVTVRLDEGG